MNKIFKIKKSMNYTLKQYAVYSVLSCYTDKDNTSHISREILSKLSGVSDLDTISKYTNQFQKDGLLNKQTRYSLTGKKLVEYKIIEPKMDYLLCTNKLFSGNAELIGFLCLLAQFKMGCTNQINLTPSELIKRMGIGRTTFYKYIKIALQDGSISKTDKGYILSEDIFPIIKPHITTEQRKTINSILSLNGRPREVLLAYYEPNTDTFSGLKGSVDDFLNYCLTGVGKHSKNQIDKEYVF